MYRRFDVEYHTDYVVVKYSSDTYCNTFMVPHASRQLGRLAYLVSGLRRCYTRLVYGDGWSATLADRPVAA